MTLYVYIGCTLYVLGDGPESEVLCLPPDGAGLTVGDLKELMR